MPVTIKISNGELIDRMTILQVKLGALPEGHPNFLVVDNELSTLEFLYAELELSEETDTWTTDLRQIHSHLWKLEDKIRIMIMSSRDLDVAMLAKDIHYFNDRRAIVKKQINDFYGEQLQEVKFFTTGLLK